MTLSLDFDLSRGIILSLWTTQELFQKFDQNVLNGFILSYAHNIIFIFVLMTTSISIIFHLWPQYQ